MTPLPIQSNKYELQRSTKKLKLARLLLLLIEQKTQQTNFQNTFLNK